MSAALPFPAAPAVEFEAIIPPPSALPLFGGAGGAAVPGSDWTAPGLSAGVQRGEEAAVRALHAAYCARLTRYALVITRGDEASAAEAVQTAFLKCLRHLRPVADEAALWAWLARAARCAIADAGRRTRRYSALLSRVTAWFTAPAAEPPPEDTEAVWYAALESALAGLDVESRTLIEARYFLRRPLAGVAAELNLTDRAVEGRLARVREKLRRTILQQLATAAADRRDET